MSIQHQGGCVCGFVPYVTTGAPLRVTVCHCTWCQRRTGTAFAVVAAFDEKRVEIHGAQHCAVDRRLSPRAAHSAAKREHKVAVVASSAIDRA
jgi:hypothetical protein